MGVLVKSMRQPIAVTLALVAPLALGMSTGAVAQDPTIDRAEGSIARVERITDRDPAEVEAFERYQRVYQERVREFSGDVKSFLEQRKQEELAKVGQGYDALVQDLERAERNQRNLAIEKLQAFLDRYPDVEDADNVRFRLAELYREKAVEVWLEASREAQKQFEEYDKLMDAIDAAEEAGDEELYVELLEKAEESEPEVPRKDFTKSIRLYEDIIQNNRRKPTDQRWQFLDRAYYSLAFSYLEQFREDEGETENMEQAEAYFRELIEEMPESQLSDAAHTLLGNLLFSEKKQFTEAIEEYKAVVARGDESDYFTDAAFQLAWTYYKLGGKDPEYERLALEWFTRILDDSEDDLLETGRESDFAPDARLNMARTLADIADRQFRNPVEVTEQFFGAIGERAWERDLYFALAEVLGGCIPAPEPCDRGREADGGRQLFDEAIAVYDKLQADPRWVTEPENPSYEIKIIKLLPLKLEPNIEQDLPFHNTRFVERYGETLRDEVTGEVKTNPWWTANRNNPDAVAVVRNFIEQSLVTVARSLMVEAQAQGDPDLYRQAADKFREYLNKFPIADNFYENQWLLANALMQAAPVDPTKPWEPIDKAAREFGLLARSSDNHGYGPGALFGVQAAREQVIKSKGDIHGPFDQLPASAVLEQTITTEFDREVKVYGLSDDHRALIQSMDAILAADIPPVSEDSPVKTDYAKLQEENEAYLRYTPGLVLHKHNRYGEARERLLPLIKDMPKTTEASFAASLVIDGLNAEGNLREVRRLTKEFISLGLGGGDVDFDCINKSALFLMAQEEIEKDNRGEAAKLYEQYMEEFPYNPRARIDEEDDCSPAKLYRDALYSAANNYDLVGKAERSNELFEDYVRKYPKDKRSVNLAMRIAGNYEAIFELDEAIEFYQVVVDADYADDRKLNKPNSPIALYNIAFAHVGLGNHQKAAEGFEEYAKKFPEQPDAADTFYKAGDEWEQVSDAKALDFYRRYLRAYPDEDPTKIIESQYKIAKFYEKAGRKRQYERYMDELVAQVDEYHTSGVQLRETAYEYAGERTFPMLVEKYEAFVADEMPERDMEGANALLLKKDQEELPAFIEEATTFIGKYPSFRYAAGSYYYMAKATFYISDLIYQIDCPFDNDDDCDLFFEIFDEQFVPVADQYQEAALKSYQTLIDFAKEEKRHNEWVDRALYEMNRIDPFTYPATKEELRGEVDTTALPTVEPAAYVDEEAEADRQRPAEVAPEVDEAPPPPPPEPDPAVSPAPTQPEPPAPEPEPAPEEGANPWGETGADAPTEGDSDGGEP